MAYQNLVGEIFGRLTVLARSPPNPNLKSRNARWECRCSCGNQATVDSNSLKRGRIKSCGCYHLELIAKYRRRRPFARQTLWRDEMDEFQKDW